MKMQIYSKDNYQNLDYTVLIINNQSGLKIENDPIFPLKNDIFLLYKNPKIETNNLDATMINISNETIKKTFLINLFNYPIIYDFLSLNNTPEYLYFKTSSSAEIAEIINLLLKNHEEFFMVHLLHVLLAKLGKDHPQYLSKIQSSMMKEYLAGSIIKYMDENSKTITLEETAQAFGYHPAYFSKLFKKIMNTSFKNMLIEIRLEKALKYLKETKLSIKTISKEVGYDDVNHFYKLFKQRFKTTPKSRNK